MEPGPGHRKCACRGAPSAYERKLLNTTDAMGPDGARLVNIIGFLIAAQFQDPWLKKNGPRRGRSIKALHVFGYMRIESLT